MIKLNTEVTLAQVDRIAQLAQDKCTLPHIACCMDMNEAKVREIIKRFSITVEWERE